MQNGTYPLCLQHASFDLHMRDSIMALLLTFGPHTHVCWQHAVTIVVVWSSVYISVAMLYSMIICRLQHAKRDRTHIPFGVFSIIAGISLNYIC